MAWVPVGDLAHCDIHDPKAERLFGPLEQCADCVRSRVAFVPTVDIDESSTPAPEGCLGADQRERRLTELALYAEQVGRTLTDPKHESRHIPHGVKMLELAIKAYRAAGDLARVREQRDYVARLERQVKKLRGGRN